MLNNITLFIEGKPFAQKRHKTVRHGIKIHSFDPSSKDKDETIISLLGKEKAILKPPILFELTAYMPIPTSLSNKKKEELLGQYHTKKPDGDNIFKFYSDLLEGYYYTNDSQIAKSSVQKIYSDKPGVKIIMTELS